MKKIFPVVTAPVVMAMLLLCGAAWSQTGGGTDAGLAGVAPDSAQGVFTILAFGARGDGQTLNTKAIQETVDACHRHGGGRVIIPTGDFVTGTIRLYSNMNIYFEAGAVLRGSKDNADYLYQKAFGFSGPGAGEKTGILVAHGETNISLSGFGVIEGCGDRFMYMDSLQQATDFSAKYTRQGSDYMNPVYGHADGPVMWKGSYAERPGMMVIFSDCRNITLSNIRFVGSPNWTIALLRSEDVKVSGVSIRNDMSIPNSDGIDMYDSKNITISDCVIESGDDAIAVISSSQINVVNCILHSRSCGIRVGYNVYNEDNSGDLLFNNISIYDSNRGIGIFQRQKGNMENMIFSHIIIHTRLHTGGWWGHGEPIHISAVPGLGSKGSGTISQVHFSHIVAESESGIVVFASGRGLIRDIYFDDVDLTIKESPLAKGYGGNIDLRPSNDPALAIFGHELPALYSVLTDGLAISNLRVQWGRGLPSYFTHAVECEDGEGIVIGGVEERVDAGGRDGRVSTVYLEGCRGSRVKEVYSNDAKKRLVEEK